MQDSQAAKGLAAPAPIATGDPDGALDGRPSDRTLLRREILAARLKVILDDELDRHKSPVVEQLASMQLTPTA